MLEQWSAGMEASSYRLAHILGIWIVCGGWIILFTIQTFCFRLLWNTLALLDKPLKASTLEKHGETVRELERTFFGNTTPAARCLVALVHTSTQTKHHNLWNWFIHSLSITAYCNNDFPATPTNSTASFSQALNNSGQVKNNVCSFHFFAIWAKLLISRSKFCCRCIFTKNVMIKLLSWNSIWVW